MRVLLFSLAFSTSAVFAQQPSAPITLISQVTIVNVVTGEETKDQTVSIQNGRILSIAPTQHSDAASPNVIDAHGGFLIPGLWDMHVHVHEVGELPLYIANGVTGVRIMSGMRNTSAYRAELSEKSPAPDIYLASAIVDGNPPLWPGSIVVTNAEEAKQTVDEIKASGADFIKVYDRIPRDAYFAIADEAKKQHIEFEGHVPDAITAQQASAAGQRSIEHLTGIALACSKNQDSLQTTFLGAKYFLDRLKVEAQALNTLDQARCQSLFAEFRQNNTWQVPTLTVLRIWGQLDDSKTFSDPRLAYVDRNTRNRWDERTQTQRQMWNAPIFTLVRGVFSNNEKVVGGMSRAGVALMAGTDAGNPYLVPGFSLHDELALLVESGLTPLAALQSATISPAKFLNRTSELGTIEVGKRADLVLLRDDPLANIHNTTHIAAVWLHGKYFDQAALADLLKTRRQEVSH